MSKTNYIRLIGNVGKLADVREINDIGTVARFPVGVYRSGKGDDKKTDWHTVEAWHDNARIAQDLQVGTRVIVEGYMKHDTKKNGEAYEHFYCVVADTIGVIPTVDKLDEEEW